jgi:hypothetical protein
MANKPMAFRRWTAVLALGLLALPGCASLSKSECRSAEWFDIGVRDGANGRNEEYLLRHAAACEKVAVAPDRELWHAGRQRGLVRYCTARNGYDLGAVGGAYSGVCVAHDEPEFLRGFDLGQEVHHLQQRVAGIESELRSTEESLQAEELEPRERRRLEKQLVVLRYQRDSAVSAYDAAVWHARDRI